MRPCGPVRQYRGPIRTVTKKELVELLTDESPEITLMRDGESFECKAPLTRLKALIRLGSTTINEEESYSHLYQKGFRTITMRGKTIDGQIVVRFKR